MNFQTLLKEFICSASNYHYEPSKVMQSIVKARANWVETSILRQISVFPNTCLKALSNLGLYLNLLIIGIGILKTSMLLASKEITKF